LDGTPVQQQFLGERGFTSIRVRNDREIPTSINGLSQLLGQINF
jgi:hypothetical protein